MMWVTLHAICLLLLPVVTLALCLCAKRRKPTGEQAVASAVIAGASAFFVLSLFGSHMCTAGHPTAQCTIIGVCLWFPLTYMDNKATRRIVSVAMVVLMALLSIHYVEVVHEDGWVGNPGHLIAVKVLNRAHLKHVESCMKEALPADETSYPNGWLRDLPIAATLDDVWDDGRPYRVESRKVWHTRFTRLYRVDRFPQDFWYPGGVPSDAADSIELRDVAGCSKGRGSR